MTREAARSTVARQASSPWRNSLPASPSWPSSLRQGRQGKQVVRGWSSKAKTACGKLRCPRLKPDHITPFFEGLKAHASTDEPSRIRATKRSLRVHVDAQRR